MNVPYVCILVGGPDRKIVAGGKEHTFEDHRMFGPMPLNRRGDPRYLGPRSPFWRAVTLWYEQGKRLDAEGRCVWDEPPDPLAGMVNIGGRNWATPELAARFKTRAQ